MAWVSEDVLSTLQIGHEEVILEFGVELKRAERTLFQ